VPKGQGMLCDMRISFNKTSCNQWIGSYAREINDPKWYCFYVHGKEIDAFEIGF